MKFFQTNAETKKRQEIEQRAAYVRRGGTLDALKPADVAELQTYALDVKDIRLYDFLETFWCGQKPAGKVRS